MKKKTKKPLSIQDPVIWVDVDDTLVLWNTPSDYPGPTVWLSLGLFYTGDKLKRSFAINTRLVSLIKKYSGTVVVWSQGGVEWAEMVVKALELEAYVDLVITKPFVLYDDLASSRWMPEPRCILPPGWRRTAIGIAYFDEASRPQSSDGDPSDDTTKQ